MKRKKVAHQSLKQSYGEVFELSLIGSLCIHIAIFQLSPSFTAEYQKKKRQDVQIEVTDIPQTEQVQLPPRPARPSIPVPTESDDVPEDLTIETTELDLSDIPDPPPFNVEHDNENYFFVAYDEPPSPIGGYAKIQQGLVYPSIALKAGIEAHVIVNALISPEGEVINTKILKDSGLNMGFEASAQIAVKSVKWRPAKQRDKSVKVWISIPIRFILKKTNV